jgi:ribose transport system substrate-binding protein
MSGRANRGRLRFLAVAALVVAVMAFAVAGCGSSDDSKSSDGKSASGAPRTLHIAAIAKTLDNPGFAVAEKGAKDRVAELGNIKLDWTAPAGADAAKEVQLIESYIQKKVDGLLIDSLGPAVCGAVDQAVDAGIPVVMWDSDCPESKRTAYVGSDNYAGGVKAGELYAAATKGKGKQRIAILTGVPGAFNLGERDRGFKDGLKKSGADYEIVRTVAGYDDLQKSVDAVLSTIRGDKSINGFYFDGPWPLLVDPKTVQPVIDRVKDGSLTVMSFDTLQPELQWVTNDWAIGLVGQKYYAWGYQGVQVLNELVRNKAKYPQIVNTGLDVVTKDGAGDHIKPEVMDGQWKTFGFKEEPIKPTG